MSAAVTDLLFRPRSVVVYGASSDPDKLSGRPLDYLRKFGYAGDLYAVNPRRDSVQGIPAYDDVASVPGPVDLAIVVVPAAAVVEAVGRCGEAGVGAAIVFASGFAEIGDGGVPAQRELAAIGERHGMRILGPNCLGSFAGTEQVFATFSTAFDEVAERPDSPIALVTQSGAVGTFTYTTMNALGIGVRYFANTGNQVDITAVELLTALADQPDVEILIGHLEDGTDLEAIERLAALADERSKPLIVLKGGKTPAGSDAVAAHTGSVAGDDAALGRILEAHGAIRLASMEATADVALAFAAGRRPRGPRLSVITQSGGAGALAVDQAIELGLVVGPWRAEDRAAAGEALPYFGSTRNPIDVTGSLINDPTILEKTLRVAGESDDTDAILIVLGNCDRVGPELVQSIASAYGTSSMPLMVSWTGGSGRPRTELLAAGVPAYPDPRRAVTALSHLVNRSTG